MCEVSGLVRAAVVGTIIAVIAVAIVYGIATAVDADLRVTAPGSDTPQTVPIATALVITALGGAVGLLLGVLARRFTPRPALTFLSVCVVLLILDGITPFTASDKASTGIWLNLMHLAAAIPIVGNLYRSLPNHSETKITTAL